MYKKIKINGLKWRLANVGSIELKFPLNHLLPLDDFERSIKNFAINEMKIMTQDDISYKGFTSCSEVNEDDCYFVLAGKENCLLFTSESEFVRYAETVRRENGILGDPELYKFWHTKDIRSFIPAYSFYRYCMSEYTALCKVDFKSNKVYSYLKHGIKDFCLEEKCKLKELELSSEFSQGEFDKYFKEETKNLNIPFIDGALNIQDELLSRDIHMEQLYILNSLAANNIEFIKEENITLDKFEQPVRNFIGKHLNGIESVITYEHYIPNIEIKLIYPSESEILYSGELLSPIDEKNFITELKSKPYESKYKYAINKQIYNGLRCNGKKLYLDYGINVNFFLVNKLTDNAVSLDFTTFNKSKNLPHLKDFLYKALSTHVNPDRFIYMIEEFIKADLQQITLISKKQK